MIECPYCDLIRDTQAMIDNHVSELHHDSGGDVDPTTVVNKIANRRVGKLSQYFEDNNLQEFWQALAQYGASQELYTFGNSDRFKLLIDEISELTAQQQVEIKALFS